MAWSFVYDRVISDLTTDDIPQDVVQEHVICDLISDDILQSAVYKTVISGSISIPQVFHALSCHVIFEADCPPRD